jgi:hypothetical protein
VLDVRQLGRPAVLNIAELAFNTVHANDFSFYEELDELVQEEPVEALDAERAGQLAAIGIVKGRPFAPDDRMRAILENAARIGGGMSRAIAYAPRDPGAVLYDSWMIGFVGGSHEFLRDGARLLDARTQFHYLATAPTTSTSAPRRPPARRPTGCRPSPASPGSPLRPAAAVVRPDVEAQ